MQKCDNSLPISREAQNLDFYMKLLHLKMLAMTSSIFKPQRGKRQFILCLTGFGHLANSLLPLIPIHLVSGCFEISALFYIIVYFFYIIVCFLTLSYLHISKGMKRMHLGKMQISGIYHQTTGSMSAIC